MYNLLEETRDKEWLDEWASITGDFDQVKGYTDFGDIFVINSKTNEIGVLLTMQNAFEPMGFTDWDKFYEDVLSNPRFQRDVVGAGFLEKVKEHCGELGENQVYIATPYPFLGGSGAADTYKPGDVWVYLSISAQTRAQIKQVQAADSQNC